MSYLHAADGIYHQSCSVNVLTEKTFLSSTNVNKIKKGEGRTTGDRRTKEAFLMPCSFFKENNEEQLTLSDLIATMEI